MPENQLYDPLAYLDSVVADTTSLEDRAHNTDAGAGLLMATAMANQYERMRRRSTDPGIVVDNFVTTAVHVLSGEVTDPDAIKAGVATLRQLWTGYINQPDAESLLPTAIQQRITELPTQAERYGITEIQAQQVSQRFLLLTAS